MKTTLHYPENTDRFHELRQKASAAYAQAVIEYIQKLSCPKAQKLMLLQAVQNASVKSDR